MHVVSRDVIGTLSQIRVILQSRRNPTLEPLPPAHERAGLLEPVTSRDRCVRGRFLGRTESSLTFGRHRPPRENHSAGMGYGRPWCPPAPVAARKLAARTNENARLRQQLEAAATVVATLHHRRENIGRNGRSRRLVTRGRSRPTRLSQFRRHFRCSHADHPEGCSTDKA